MDFTVKGNVSANTSSIVSQLCSRVSSFSAGRKMMAAGNKRLDRWQMKSMSDHLQVFPVMIHLPFSLVDGSPLDAALPIPMSVRSAIKLIKSRANECPEVKEALMNCLGIEEDKLNFGSDEVTREEFLVFKPLRDVAIYGHHVIRVIEPNGRSPYGSTYRVELEFDPETGDIVDSPNNSDLYVKHQIETIIYANKVQDIREKNLAAGDQKRTDAEIEKTISGIWKSRRFSSPYFMAVTRILSFPTNNQYELSADFINGWNGEKSAVVKNEYWVPVSKTMREAIDNTLNSKYDRYEDYLLMKVHVPEFTDETRGTAAQGISRTAASAEDSIEDALKKFNEAYSAYRDDMDMWDEKNMLRISAFKQMSSERSNEIFSVVMSELKEYMKIGSVIEKYGDVIAQANAALAEELMQSAMMGEVSEPVQLQETAAAAPLAKQEDFPEEEGLTSDFSLTSEDMATLTQAPVDPAQALAQALSM